jgi:hypothetical protein
MQLLSQARSLIEAPQFENRAGYCDAKAWYEGLDHSAHADASEEKLAHARWTYEMASAAVDLNNEKAYKLLQFAAILAGGLIASLKLGEHLIQRWWLAIPSLLFFAVSIVAALAAKIAADCPYPMRTDRAVEMDGGEDVWRTTLAASLHCVTAATYELADWKARRVNAAIYFLVAGINLLMLLLFA